LFNPSLALSPKGSKTELTGEKAEVINVKKPEFIASLSGGYKLDA